MTHANIIVDTSVLVKWFLPDEEDETAMQIKQAFTLKTLTISIPYLTYYEIGNVLRTAVKRDRINKETANKLYQAFFALKFIPYATRDLFTTALSQSMELDISLYDATYVALSEYLQVPLVTADQKLLKKVRNKFIIDVKEYTV
jgi:predicted nucleic acid-binding protein